MKLTDSKIKIVTVHPSGTIRNLINTELRNRGYSDVVGAPDLQTVIGILETGLIHWLITPVIADDKINVYQILRLITEDPSMMDMRVSFILDESSDLPNICKAFDMGLLSCHRKMSTKADIEEEFKSLFACDLDCAGDLSLVAGEYLRQLLRESARTAELLKFEKNLLQLHVGNLKQLLHLAEAYLMNHQAEQAEQLFSQALLVDPALKPEIEALIQRYQEEAKAISAQAPMGLEMLGIKSCLVLDPDTESLQLIESLLKKLGVKEIQLFQEPKIAIQWLKGPVKPELIIFEWRLPDTPGPIFVQSVRSILGFGVPLTVMNKDLTDRDLPVLHEMGVTDRIRKPIEAQAFFQDLIWVINQDRSPSEPIVLLQKIHHAMHNQDFEKLAAYTKRFMDSDKVQDSEKLLLQGELAYFRGNYPSARQLALQVLKSGVATVEVLNLLGKALMKLRDFEGALRCLENAEVLSPANVKRICQMAEAHLEQGELEAYEEKLSDAQDIAPEDHEVKELELKGSLVQGDSVKAKELMQSLQSLMNIVSFTNNRAIALIRNQRFEEGLALYEEAIQSIPNQQIELLSTLHYNKGLALARNQKLGEAKEQMEKALALKSDKIKSKISSLKQRIQKAIDGHEKLELQAVASGTKADLSTDPQKDFEKLMMALTINPGDLCLHKVWVEVQVSPALKELIEKPLRFKKRSTISRQDTKAS